MNNYYTNQRNEVIELIPHHPRRVLELGCGAGVFGAKLKEIFGCHVVGIELFPEAGRMAMKCLDKVYIESLDTFDFSQLGKYDLIVANDVLEHLIDPWNVVLELRNHLNEDGYFMASIPNVSHHQVLTGLLKGRRRYEDSGILDRTHLRFFTRETAVKLFTDNNYKIHTCVPINKEKLKKTNIWHQFLHIILPDIHTLQFEVIATK